MSQVAVCLANKGERTFTKNTFAPGLLCIQLIISAEFIILRRQKMNNSITNLKLLNILIGLVLILAMVQGCKNNRRTQSPLFEQLFRDDSTTFRGLDPGDSLGKVTRLEDENMQLFEDELGLSYRYFPYEGVELLIDYHSDNLQTEQQTDRVTSIVTNILMEDEVEIAKLYNEMQAYFNRKYGVSSGSYGDLRWNGITHHLTRMEVQLRLADSRNAITMNFVDTDPKSKPGISQ